MVKSQLTNIIGLSTPQERIAAMIDFFKKEKCTEFIFIGFSGIGKKKRIVISIDNPQRGIEASVLVDAVKDKLLEADIYTINPTKQ